jgi:hypothetical protein
VFDGLLGESGKQYISEKYRVIKDRDFLIIAKKAEENSGYVLIEHIKKPIEVPFDAGLQIQ